MPNYTYSRDQYLADLQAKRWCQFVPEHERPLLSSLIKKCLAGGNTISLNDGESWILRRCRSFADVKCHLGHTGEDYLKVYNNSGDFLGSFYLIYNNGSEEDPCVVIADYYANEFCDAIHTELMDKY